ncbi:hypothetical protein JCM10207_002106 [Rhodosporidiobolus poonsookiae]
MLAQTARQEVLLEYSNLGLADHCPLGVYVVPSDESVFLWHCTLFVHRGYYASSILHFRLLIPQSYPSAPPSVVFDSPLFHPLVDPSSGRLRLDARFPTWRPRQDFLSHVLHYVKGVMKRRALDGLREAFCANGEAYDMYRHSPAQFARLAAQSARLSTAPSNLYRPCPPRSEDAPVTPIQFRRLEEPEEERLRDEVRRLGEGKVVKRQAAGLD